MLNQMKFFLKSKLKNSFDIIFNRGPLIFIKSFFNLLYLTIIKFLTNKELICIRVDNYKMNVYTMDNGISRSLVLFGTREEDKKFILNTVLNKKMNIFDIGANIGYYTLFFLKNSNSQKILAVEPSKKNLNLCKNNVSINSLNTKNINFLCAGVSDKNTTKKFFLANQSNLHTFNPDGSAQKFLSGKSNNVKVHSIYDLSNKFFVPDLIRMDVEGHEKEIISGMLKYIKKKNLNPHIVFEPHIATYDKNKFADVLNNLFKLNYFTQLLSSNAKSGTDRILKIVKKKPIVTLSSDGERRAIFKDVNPQDTIEILTKTGGARTVLLSPLKIN